MTDSSTSAVVAPRRSRLAVGGAAALLLLTLAATPTMIVQTAERSKVYDVAEIARVPERPVALVLGAGLRPDGTPSRYLARRLDAARLLYEQGTVEVLLVSGDNSTSSYDEPTAMKTWLVDHGVPTDRIVLDYAGLDTHDSCRRAADLFGVTEAVVVTQDYHLPRALFSCNRAGIDAVGVGVSSASVSTTDAVMYRVREAAASAKAWVDALTNRPPAVGGPTEPGVHDALRTARGAQS